MNANLLRNRLRRTAWTAVALTLVAACDRGDAPIGAPPPSAGPAIGLEASALDARPGNRVVVAVRATADEPLAGLQGYVRFDPTRLRYVGQVPDGVTLAITNESAAGRGELRVLSAKVDGLPARTAVYVFDVLTAGYDRGLEYRLELGATVDLREITRATVASQPLLATDLPSAEPRRLALADWDALLYPEVLAATGPQLTPGQYLLNLRYGDARLDNNVNILDYSYIANVSVGNNAIIVGTDAPSRDAVVAGNVRPANNPGLGEPSDANPPGRDANGGRTINILDALAIANEAVGNNQDIAGELIPGRGPLATTHTVLVADEVLTDPVVGQVHVIRTNRTLDPNTIWELPGIVSVREGAVLTIQPGTRVEGQSPPVKSALFIERDGRLIADGTPLEPIVFTCTAATKTRGCWGGIWIAGNAHVNEGGTGLPASPPIAGRATGGCLQRQGEGGATLFGGCSDTDSSGVLRYLVIEYAGFILQSNNELNGLTMGGVGGATVVDNIQVHAGLDDGVELFGGTVNLKHLYLTANSDDSFDFAFGWNGKAQFILIQHDSSDGDKGFEVDNTETAATFNNTPRTGGQIFNVTFVGRQNPSGTGGVAGNNSNDALHIRRGARPEMRNFLVLSARLGMDLDDVATCTAINTDLRLTNSLIAGLATVGNGDVDPNCPPYTTGTESNLEQLFLQDAANSNTVAASAAGLLVSPFNVMIPDFRPVNGSLAGTLTGLTPPNDGFFDVSATYVGAVQPSTSTGGNIPWYSGWTRGYQSATQP